MEGGKWRKKKKKREKRKEKKKTRPETSLLRLDHSPTCLRGPSFYLIKGGMVACLSGAAVHDQQL